MRPIRQIIKQKIIDPGNPLSLMKPTAVPRA